MSTPPSDQLSQVETTCGTLLNELRIIWDEVGENDVERDKMLLELERECLEVYRRKVDLANKCHAQLRQAIADSEAELAAICSAMGERPVHIIQADQTRESLKAELRAILPELEEMKKRKSERRNLFLEVLEQIQRIQKEIYTNSDLSLRKLEELHSKTDKRHPNTVKDHCNFAVNSYYQKKGQVQGSCVFSGTTTVSQTPPSGANSVCYSGNPSCCETLFSQCPDWLYLNLDGLPMFNKKLFEFKLQW